MKFTPPATVLWKEVSNGNALPNASALKALYSDVLRICSPGSRRWYSWLPVEPNREPAASP
jgi:hypothetical protein